MGFWPDLQHQAWKPSCWAGLTPSHSRCATVRPVCSFCLAGWYCSSEGSQVGKRAEFYIKGNTEAELFQWETHFIKVYRSVIFEVIYIQFTGLYSLPVILCHPLSFPSELFSTSHLGVMRKGHSIPQQPLTVMSSSGSGRVLWTLPLPMTEYWRAQPCTAIYQSIVAMYSWLQWWGHNLDGSIS